MFCCFQSLPDEHSAEIDVNRSTYPGQRRKYVKTAGNALADARPTNEYSQGNADVRPLKVMPPPPSAPQEEGELVSVTVPAGVRPGQEIHVAHPSGDGRLIKATVPQGMSTGSVFYVRAPVSQFPSSPEFTSSPLPPPMKVPDVPPPIKVPDYAQSELPSAIAHPIDNYTDAPAVAASASAPFAQCLDSPNGLRTPPPPSAPLEPYPARTAPVVPNTNSHLLKVSVPRGTAPGSTLHVQVPGENRMIAAVVPPNCSEFHVQYEPQLPASPIVSPIQQPEVSQGEKLLLVTVPPGATVGSTLHVQVPGEPGRLLSARVPPGNVREFHVSYRPNSSTGPQHHNARRATSQPQYQQERSHTNNHNNSNGGDWGGSSMLPFAGGLASGVAAAMAFDHFAHGDNSDD